MKITYFQDTDTLYLEFNNNPIVETQEINENTKYQIQNTKYKIPWSILISRGIFVQSPWNRPKT